MSPPAVVVPKIAGTVKDQSRFRAAGEAIKHREVPGRVDLVELSETKYYTRSAMREI